MSKLIQASLAICLMVVGFFIAGTAALGGKGNAILVYVVICFGSILFLAGTIWLLVLAISRLRNLFFKT